MEVLIPALHTLFTWITPLLIIQFKTPVLCAQLISQWPYSMTASYLVVGSPLWHSNALEQLFGTIEKGKEFDSFNSLFKLYFLIISNNACQFYEMHLLDLCTIFFIDNWTNPASVHSSSSQQTNRTQASNITDKATTHGNQQNSTQDK